MPRKYTRKSTRASWTEDQLKLAIEKIKDKSLNVNKASVIYKIPYRTLKRRLDTNNTTKKSLGKHPSLGYENEIRLINHIKRLQNSGFAPSAMVVRSIAYNFAKSLGKEFIFGPRGTKEERAGEHWFRSFMERSSDLSIRKSEGLSVARAKGMNRKEVNQFYDLLKNTIIENDLQNKPSRIFNMDETGIQLINKPGKVVASKGSKCVYSITPKEKGESLSLIACTNAEGIFLPPVLIMKGVRNYESRLNGLPPGATIYMNKKISYINTDLFIKWMKEIFIPRKPQGNVLLLLDGHSSHTSYEVIQLATENNVTILCLPSHTTQALQPLDRAFFKPLKEYYRQEAQDWMISNKEKNITRDAVGVLIGNAWRRAATAKNGYSGFEAAGIRPFNRNAVPDYFFAISDASLKSQNIHPTEKVTIDKAFLENDANYIFMFTDDMVNETNAVIPEEEINNEIEPAASTSMAEDPCTDTPSKILYEIAPVPQIPINKSKRKQSAKILIHDVTIIKPKTNLTKPVTGETKNREGKESVEGKENKKATKIKINSKGKQKERNDVVDDNKHKEDKCIECEENYYETSESVDWIECIGCLHWLHETCTMYGDRCNQCGRLHKRKLIAMKRKL